MPLHQLTEWPHDILSGALKSLERLRMIDMEVGIDTRDRTVSDMVNYTKEPATPFGALDIIDRGSRHDPSSLIADEIKPNVFDTSLCSGQLDSWYFLVLRGLPPNALAAAKQAAG